MSDVVTKALLGALDFLHRHAGNGQPLSRYYDPRLGACVLVARTPETAMLMSQYYDIMCQAKPDETKNVIVPIPMSPLTPR